MNMQQIHDFVVYPTLKYLELNSEAARRLLMGTIAHESKGFFIDQVLGPTDRQLGPAYGLFQIEPATHDDVWVNFLSYRPDLQKRMEALRASFPASHIQLATNLYYATAVARYLYYRRPEALPKADDDEGLAEYWKSWYNSELGSGTITKFLYDYRERAKDLIYDKAPENLDV